MGLDLIINYLIKVYRGSVAMAYVLKPWRDVRVILTPKSGTEPNLAKFYRPVSFLSFMLKTLERFMGRFLRSGTHYRSHNMPIREREG